MRVWAWRMRPARATGTQTVRPARLLQHPLAIAIVLVAIIVNAAMQPAGQAGASTTIGKLFAWLTFRNVTTPGTLPLQVLFVHFAEGQWRIGNQSYSPTGIEVQVWQVRTRRDGIWSVIEQKKTQAVLLTEVLTNKPSECSPSDRAAIISAVNVASPGWIDPDLASQLATRNFARCSRVLWTGVANDALVLLMFIALIVSVRHNLDRIAGARRRRLELCPRCSYDLAGLRGPLCPECGSGRRFVHTTVAPTPVERSGSD